MVHDFRAHAVYTKEHWADEWVEVDHLFAERVTFCLSPEMPEAILSYNYGEIQGYGENSFATRLPLSLLNHYVHVVIHQGENEQKYWYGIIVDDTKERHGDYAGDIHESGRQILIARGLEFLLHRKPITTSSVLDVNENIKEVNFAIAFNCGSGHETEHIESGNMGLDDGGDPRFAANLQNPQKWSSRDVLRYMVANHAPTSPAVMSWSIANPSLELLDALAPSFHYHGASFADVVNKVCDRRRLMTWYVDVVDSQPQIVVVTFNDNLLTLPDGTVIPANANVFDWQFEDDARIKAAIVSTTAATQYTQVIAQGEKATGTFTICNTAIDADWSTGIETEYEAGASAATDYATWDDLKKMNSHQRFRKSDKLLKAFRYFRIKSDWDGKAMTKDVCPIKPGDVQASFWWPGLRILSRLPLKTETDYSYFTAITDASKEATRPEYRRPFIIFEELETTSGPAGANIRRYAFLDRTAIGNNPGEDATTRQWAATLRPQETMPGFIIDVHGAAQHVIALDSFTPCDAVDAMDWMPEVDWRRFRFTICAEFHEFAEGKWPADNPEQINGERDSVLIIKVPNKRADYMPTYTVIDINKNGDLVYSAGGWIQDDREELKNIARSAFEWYSQPRAAVEIVQHNLTAIANANVFHVGHLLGNISRPNTSTAVNGIVNKMVFDLRQGTLSITTTFTEFDFVKGLS